MMKHKTFTSVLLVCGVVGFAGCKDEYTAPPQEPGAPIDEDVLDEREETREQMEEYREEREEANEEIDEELREDLEEDMD